IEGDGVRELYVGSLAHIGQDAFPSYIDYLALGHLHVPQRVGTVERIRYCGSPIPMGYGEAAQEKQVVLVVFDGSTPIIRDVQVPSFQQLVRIVGPLEAILAKIEQLTQDESRAWLEIEYSGSEVVANLREIIDEAVADSAMEVLRIKNRRVIERVIRAVTDEETLDDLKISDVFARCLETFNVPEEDRDELTSSHNEIIQSLDEEDVNAE
ncbi:MAG: exonuclease SbcCD subunit D C-terminal domain-containing protein, partial [Desulfocapsaceae bacterium]|nr:exonuclease SbcCD subunit D C-terminal domain-containing protein [Desulfocapsaceae bacterium]